MMQIGMKKQDPGNITRLISGLIRRGIFLNSDLHPNIELQMASCVVF
jgi:hypothetical protein